MSSSQTLPPSRCLTCLSRKVKCDGKAGTCARCERLKLPCRWPDNRSSSRQNPNITAAGHPRFRTAAACKQCRQRKLKCDGTQPCATCTRRATICTPQQTNSSLVQTTSPLGQDSVSQDSPPDQSTNEALVQVDCPIQRGQVVAPRPTSLAELLPSDKALRAILDTYFAYVHPVSCNNYLHHGTLFNSLRSRTNHHLLLALCSVSAKFTGDSNIVEQAQAWTEGAKSFLSSSLNNVSTPNIAILQTLALSEVHEGDFTAAWSLTNLAFRFVLQLRLHEPEPLPHDVSHSKFLRHETQIRLSWSVYILYCLLLCDESIGNEDVFHRLPLPCNPWNFSQSLPCETFYLPDILKPSGEAEKARSTNVCAYLIKIISLRSEVMRYNESLKNSDTHQLLPWQVRSKFHRLSELLELFRQSLRNNLAFETRTLYNFRSSRQLDMFLMIHMWFHHSNCQLSALWIQTHPRAQENAFLASSPAQFTRSCAVKSIFHAQQMSWLVQAALQLDPQHEFADPWLALCMRDSIQVSVAALQAHVESDQKEELIRSININMDVLAKMKQRFKLASKTHDACVSSLCISGLEGWHSEDTGLSRSEQSSHYNSSILAIVRRYPFTGSESEHDDIFNPASPTAFDLATTQQPPSPEFASAPVREPQIVGELSWFGGPPVSHQDLSSNLPNMFNGNSISSSAMEQPLQFGVSQMGTGLEGYPNISFGLFNDPHSTQQHDLSFQGWSF